MLALMLSLCCLPISAQNAELGGLHCGDVVVITATPDPGYRFVRWSDGNTDNPREIEISDAVNLTAIYEPVEDIYQVPVVWLYNQLIIVDLNSLSQKGYVCNEQNVTWYRIVGDMDATSSQHDDQVVGTGYYYPVPLDQTGIYYVAVDIGGTMLYSKPIQKGGTAIEPIADDSPIRLIPNYVAPGAVMQLTGLHAAQRYRIQTYDAVGRKIEEYILVGEEQYPITAQYIPGYYLLKIISKEQEQVLRYIVR